MARWATFILKRAVLPSMSMHMKYWSLKLRFDRYLEQYSISVQVALATTFGVMLFVSSFPFLATESDKWFTEMMQETWREAKRQGVSSLELSQGLQLQRREMVDAIYRATSFVKVEEAQADGAGSTAKSA